MFGYMFIIIWSLWLSLDVRVVRRGEVQEVIYYRQSTYGMSIGFVINFNDVISFKYIRDPGLRFENFVFAWGQIGYLIAAIRGLIFAPKSTSRH